MTAYRYEGPLTGLDLTGPDGTIVWSAMLRPGRIVTPQLPADHPEIAVLVHAGHLVPVAPIGTARTAPIVLPDSAPAADPPPIAPMPEGDPDTPVETPPASRRRAKES